jgi:hypothetical protein
MTGGFFSKAKGTFTARAPAESQRCGPLRKPAGSIIKLTGVAPGK